MSDSDLIFVGGPPALSPSLAGPRRTGGCEAADLVKTYCAPNLGMEMARLSMTPNSVPDLTSASASFS